MTTIESAAVSVRSGGVRRVMLAGLAALALSLCSTAVQAVITCTVSVTSINAFYNPSGSNLVMSAGYTVNCTRSLTDPSTISWTLWANNGLHAQGNNRRVLFSGNYYLYDLYTSPGLGNNAQWQTGPNQKEFAGTINFSGSTNASYSSAYYLQVTAPQTVGPAGVYTDLLVATLTYPAGSATTAVTGFNINLSSISNCVLTAPTNLTFNYSSFQGAAATPSANFTVNCTTGLPYTMALDNTGPITDNALNLTYTLGLSAASGTGSGATQTFTVNGNMPAGQSGTCAAATCNNSLATNKTRTITVTY